MFDYNHCRPGDQDRQLKILKGTAFGSVESCVYRRWAPYVLRKHVYLGDYFYANFNLTPGFRKAVHPEARFYQGDIRDRAFMDSVFEKEDIDGVIHFAASSQVVEKYEGPA